MAIVNFRVHHLTQRSSGATSRVVQYLTREGRYAPTQAEVEYLARTSPATAERDDLVYQETANLPPWAHGDAQTFFKMAERMEGENRRWGTTWQLALPRELGQEAQRAMARAFLETHLATHAYLFVIHDPVSDAGQHQPHVHVLFSERAQPAHIPGPTMYFRRPEAGGCAKDRWLNHRSSVTEVRHAWCDFSNYTLERAGHEARMHPSSLYTRNIGRQPEPKVGPGKDPTAMAERERIRQSRDEAHEQALAAEGWALRKTKLGIPDVHALPPYQFLAESRSRARGVQPGQWAPGTPSPQQQTQARTRRQHQAIERSIQGLETELRILTRRQQTIHLPRMPRRDREARGGGLRANFREEDEYGRQPGYSR